MKSPNTLIRVSRGFSLIEIIVVLAILGIIAGFEVLAGIDMYGRYVKRSEIENVIGLLEKARSLAINNINESPYGVNFADPDNLILFKGTSLLGGAEYMKLPKNKSVAYDFSSCSEVSFAQLSGATANCQIKINNITIAINNEGGINY